MRHLRTALGRLRSEAGHSIVELTTALTLMLIVGTAVGATLISSMRATNRLESASAVVDELRLAMAGLEREFRSAECVYDPIPANPGDPASGTSLHFTTRANGGSTELVYAVSGGELTRTQGTASRVIASGLVAPIDPFTYVETPRKSIDVLFVVEREDGEREELLTTVAGRNAWRNC